MKDVYLVERRRRRRRAPWLLLILGALLCYAASFPADTPDPRVVSTGVRVTREETLSSHRFYLLTLCTGREEALLRPEAARFAQRGAAGELRKQEDGWVCVGMCCESQQVAESWAARLRENGDAPEAEWLALDAPEMRIRATATSGQIAVLLKADETPVKAIWALGTMAEEIDRGALDGTKARSRAEEVGDWVETARREMEEISWSGKDKAPGLLKKLLTRMEQDCGALGKAETEGRLAMSSMARQLQTEWAQAYCNYRAQAAGD